MSDFAVSAEKREYGKSSWIDAMVKEHGLEQTVHPVGRPKKNGG